MVSAVCHGGDGHGHDGEWLVQWQATSCSSLTQTSPRCDSQWSPALQMGCRWHCWHQISDILVLSTLSQPPVPCTFLPHCKIAHHRLKLSTTACRGKLLQVVSFSSNLRKRGWTEMETQESPVVLWCHCITVLTTTSDRCRRLRSSWMLLKALGGKKSKKHDCDCSTVKCYLSFPDSNSGQR